MGWSNQTAPRGLTLVRECDDPCPWMNVYNTMQKNGIRQNPIFAFEIPYIALGLRMMIGKYVMNCG
jgi:hypothetical protein